jgi:3-(3-hydroxy-phenyl)propionate hydroxylase
MISTWFDPRDVQVERAAVYRFHGLARTWRAGSVFLAGDAAHQMPPFLGQGMCSGLRDAANLAWKLDLVISGKAAASLLDTDEIERRPHVSAIVTSAVSIGRVICTIDPVRGARTGPQDAGRRQATHPAHALHASGTPAWPPGPRQRRDPVHAARDRRPAAPTTWSDRASP